MVVVTWGRLEDSSCTCLAIASPLARADAAEDQQAAKCDQEGTSTGSNGNDGDLAERAICFET